MPQLLLIPDPKPLVERLGPDFFRQAPEKPGVYLMRDAAECVLYVGKAKNLRKRLASYRVANPQRLKRRQLRLLRAVERIDFEECADEPSALARESELLLSLRPRFNRAGVWPGARLFLAWRVTAETFELALLPGADPAWAWHGPLNAGAIAVRAALARLLWCVLAPARGFAGLPEGWCHGRLADPVSIPCANALPQALAATKHLSNLAAGDGGSFAAWLENSAPEAHPFCLAMRTADLETVCHFFGRASELPAAAKDPQL